MNFTKVAKLTHINLRAEGKDEKALVADVKFSTVLESDDLIDFHPNLVSLLWDADGNPRFRTLIESVKLKAELRHHDVTAQRIVIRDACLHKFNVAPLPLHSASVEFTATFRPGSQLVAQLSEWLQQDLELYVRPMADLFTGLQDGVPQDVTLSNGERVTVTVNPGAKGKRKAAEKPAKQKRPGGNRRQRVPKHEESEVPAKVVQADKAWPWPKRPNGRDEG